MVNDNEQKNSRQAKSAFVLRDTPAWLDQHQEWISDGARRLYKTLRSLADCKTGALLIPDRGWIRLHTVEQKAGMSHNTRVKYMRELRILGGVSEHRDYVTRSIHGRNRKVLGVAQITVLPLRAPSTHKHRVSTTDQSREKANPEPQHKISTTDQSTTDQSESGLLQTNSSAALKVVSQDLSETTNSGPDDVQPFDSISRKPAREGVGQKAPTPETDHPPELIWLVKCLKNNLREELFGWNPTSPLPNLSHIYDAWKRQCLAYAVDWKKRNDLYAEAVVAVRAESEEIIKWKQKLIDSLAECLRDGFREAPDDENLTCHAFEWFEYEAKQLGIPEEELGALYIQTCDAVCDEYYGAKTSA